MATSLTVEETETARASYDAALRSLFVRLEKAAAEKAERDGYRVTFKASVLERILEPEESSDTLFANPAIFYSFFHGDYVFAKELPRPKAKRAKPPCPVAQDTSLNTHVHGDLAVIRVLI